MTSDEQEEQKSGVKNVYRQQVIGSFPNELPIGTTMFVKDRDLRYGENPGRPAAFYREFGTTGPSLGMYEVLQENPEKKLSFINLLDAAKAIQILNRLKQLYPQQTISAVMKHVNPSGVAKGDVMRITYRDAWECDPVSAFGGVIGFSDMVDVETAKEVASNYVEVLVAPGYASPALEVLAQKKDLRIIQVKNLDKPLVDNGLDYKRVPGGLLVQQRFVSKIDSVKNLECVSRREPTSEELETALFNWNLLPFINSNAIVISDQNKTIGIGSGQRSRIDAAELAVRYAHNRSKQEIRGRVMGSDAYFPETDAVNLAGKEGIRAIVYPLGSNKDAEVIDVANQYSISMLITRPVIGDRKQVERAFSH